MTIWTAGMILLLLILFSAGLGIGWSADTFYPAYLTACFMTLASGYFIALGVRILKCTFGAP